MSNAHDVMEIIRAMRLTRSRADLETLTGQIASTDFGQKVLKWTYDPFVTFGLTPPMLPITPIGAIQFDMAIIGATLETLAARELTGNAAMVWVETMFSQLDRDGVELLYLILSKDLKAGVAETTIQKVAPGIFPAFSVMRAHSYQAKRIKKWPVIVEPKLDGMRVTFLCKDGNGGFFSRSGNRQPSLDHLVEPTISIALEAAVVVSASATTHPLRAALIGDIDVRTIERQHLNFMLDGEALSGNRFESIGDVKRQSEDATGTVFNMFDLMSYADFDAVGSVGLPYIERRVLVEQFVAFAAQSAWRDRFAKTPRFFANSDAEIGKLYEGFLEQGLEGAMVKIPDGLYDKKKTYGWMKLKPEDTEDLPIVGVFNGEAGTKYEHILGGVIVRRPNGVDVRVGGGFTDDQRFKLWEDWKRDAALIGIDPVVGFKALPVPEASRSGLPAPTALLGRLLEVKFQEPTPDGSLSHPRAVRFRDDKAGERESKEAA